MTHRFHASAPLIAALALVFAPAGGAYAGTSGTVALTSDYLFRGISQNDQRPALQAGLDYTADNGLYGGAWASNVSWLADLSTAGAPVSNSLELDVYAGYRGKLGDRVTFDVGALYYAYPGQYPDGFNSPDTGELYAGVSIVPHAGISVGAKFSYAVTDLFGYADSDGSGYLDLSANWEFAPSWTLNLHGGRQRVRNNGIADYADWRIGVSKSFANGFSTAIAYSDTDADAPFYTNPHGRFLGEDAVVLTFARAF